MAWPVRSSEVDAADLSQRQLDEVANVPIEGCLNDIEGDGESLLDSDLHEGIGLQGDFAFVAEKVDSL
jgi:hypothetical protein